MPRRSRLAAKRMTGQRNRTPVQVRCRGVTGPGTRRSRRARALISVEPRLPCSPSLWHWPVVLAG